MAEIDEAQRAQRRRQRERQYEIDRITAQYVDEFRAGRSPQMEDYVQRHPQYAHELLEFAVYFHTVGYDAAEPEEIPAAELSPAAQRSLAQIRERYALASTAPIEGLVKEGTRVGYSPRQLAAAVGLSTDLLAKLEAHAISAATIPRTLIGRLADTLKVAPDVIAAYLAAAGAAQASAFYYADQPPTQQQESFLDAVQVSTLSAERKREWAEIVTEDADRGA